MKSIKPFVKPIYVTRPLLPSLKTINITLRDIWKNQWLTNNGPILQILEKKLTKLLDVKELSLFNNGTNALIAAIKALDLKGEIITTPFTFAATPHSVSWNNLDLVFCDIDPKTACIDAEKIESLITPKTSAILAVHVFGNPCNVKLIDKIAKKHNLKIIYDAAHAFQLEIDGKGIGNWGDIVMYSFHSTKLFHTIEGGALATRDTSLRNKIDLLKNFGIIDEDNVEMIGINGKMNEIQAAVGLANINLLKEERNRRKTIRDIYVSNLSKINGISLYEYGKDINPSYQYFAIKVNESEYGISRDKLYEKLKTYNVFARKYFYPLCSNFKCYKQLASSSIENLPISNKLVEETMALPFYGKLKDAEVIKICKIIKNLSTSL